MDNIQVYMCVKNSNAVKGKSLLSPSFNIHNRVFGKSQLEGDGNVRINVLGLGLVCEITSAVLPKFEFGKCYSKLNLANATRSIKFSVRTISSI